MAEIKIRDYEEDFWGYLNVIGMGRNHSSIILPQIDKAIADKDTEITVFINTIGGSVWCSLAIKNALRRAKEAGARIITINEGICASAGTPIFMEGDDRIVYTSLFMIHKPSLFVFGNMTDDDMKREAEGLKICQDTLLTTYAPTGLDEATLTEMLEAETWLTPALCLSLGFATENRSAPDQKANILEPTMDMINKISPANRVYANKYFNTISLKNNNMDVKETLKQNTEAMKKSNSVMDQLKAFFVNLVKQEEESDEEVVEETAEEVAEEVTETQEVEVIEETQEVKDLKAENLALNDALTEATNNIKKITNTLESIKDIKSKYKPEAREQEIIDKNDKNPKNEGITMDAIKARREERKQKNKK